MLDLVVRDKQYSALSILPDRSMRTGDWILATVAVYNISYIIVL